MNMKFEDFLKKLLSDESEDETYIQIGVISKERIAEINQIEYDTEDMKDEIQRKMEDYTKKLQRDYSEKVSELEKRNKQFWENVYKDIGSNGKGNHRLDRKTGEIKKQLNGAGYQ